MSETTRLFFDELTGDQKHAVQRAKKLYRMTTTEIMDSIAVGLLRWRTRDRVVQLVEPE